MFGLGAQPVSPEEWFRLAQRQAQVARDLLRARHSGDAWGHAGYAIELCLKASIAKQERFNRWPTKDQRPDLYRHDLAELMRTAGIDRKALIKETIGPRWQVVLLWRRGESYNPGAMPMKMAEDMCEAALGAEGVLQWLATRFRLTT